MYVQALNTPLAQLRASAQAEKGGTSQVSHRHTDAGKVMWEGAGRWRCICRNRFRALAFVPLGTAVHGACCNMQERPVQRPGPVLRFVRHACRAPVAGTDLASGPGGQNSWWGREQPHCHHRVVSPMRETRGRRCRGSLRGWHWSQDPGGVTTP